MSFLDGFRALAEGMIAALSWGRSVEVRKPLSDEEAFRADWEAVGNDMRKVLGQKPRP